MTVLPWTISLIGPTVELSLSQKEDTRMVGRGSFQTMEKDDVDSLLALPFAERWDFAADERAAVFVARMDKAWGAIHCSPQTGSSEDLAEMQRLIRQLFMSHRPAIQRRGQDGN